MFGFEVNCRTTYYLRRVVYISFTELLSDLCFSLFCFYQIFLKQISKSCCCKFRAFWFYCLKETQLKTLRHVKEESKRPTFPSLFSPRKKLNFIHLPLYKLNFIHLPLYKLNFIHLPLYKLNFIHLPLFKKNWTKCYEITLIFCSRLEK